MEDDFWNQRKEENKDHCVIEYKNGIQYVYACKCNQCLTPMTTLKPGKLSSADDCGDLSCTATDDCSDLSCTATDDCGDLSCTATDDCEYCYFNICDVHIDERLVLYKNKEIPNSDNYDKSMHWKTKSNKRRARKQEQALSRKLSTQTGIHS